MHKILLCIALVVVGCAPTLKEQAAREANTTTPESFGGGAEQTSSGSSSWNEFFNDQNLLELINLALNNNQELNIAIQDIYIANNEAFARSGEYLPRLYIGGGAGL